MKPKNSKECKDFTDSGESKKDFKDSIRYQLQNDIDKLFDFTENMDMSGYYIVALGRSNTSDTPVYNAYATSPKETAKFVNTLDVSLIELKLKQLSNIIEPNKLAVAADPHAIMNQLDKLLLALKVSMAANSKEVKVNSSVDDENDLEDYIEDNNDEDQDEVIIPVKDDNKRYH